MRQTLLADCAARSRPLDAYLDPDEGAELPDSHDPDELLADWRDAFDSEEAFRERLSFADLTVEDVRERLRAASTGDPDSTPSDDADSSSDPDATPATVGIPAHFETAEAVVDRAVELPPERVGSLVERHADSPFVDLLAPLVGAASERLDLGPGFAPSAVESLEDRLFERLTEVFQHPLFILFKAHQRTEYPDVAFGERADSTEVYEEFVARHREADYEAVFETYPVLLGLLGDVTDQWLRSAGRLADRIAADRDALARTFTDGDDLGAVADVTALSDDPHGDGEIVFGVEFAGDCSVVYKPRSVETERAFGTVLEWTNANAAIPDLYVPNLLDRGTYGWMELVDHRECDSERAVERYYERMGGLVALAFALDSTDLHQDNVVAMGEYPVIVDQEMALSPEFETTDDPSSPALSSLVADSILKTVLVPFTSSLSDEDAEVLTNSGLAELDDVEAGQETPTFVDPNTDAMELTFEGTYRPDGTNLPRRGGEIRSVSDHVEQLKRGFREVADVVRTNREAFAASDGPLGAFEGCEIRYLLRPTGHYASKLTESVYSSQLRSGIERSLALESLYRIFVPTDDEGDLWKLVDAERETLRRFTVPRFTVDATGHQLRDGRGEPQGVFVDQSPLADARERVADLDEHWTETQLRLLDLAFTDSKVPGPVSSPSGGREESAAGIDAPSAAVSHVVDRLATTTTEYPDGSYRWAELARLSPTDAFLLQEPTRHLYEGYPGVGLFLAAVASVRDDDDLAGRARRVLKPVELAFEEDPPDLGVGGARGTGSAAYGLAAAGAFLEDSGLLETASEVARRTTREEIRADETLDVVGGAAGELLAQLAVHDRTGDGAALDRARWCGRRLLDATTETSAGYRVPTTGDDRFAFAHGVGGIGAALVRLAGVTGDDEFARVGRDALELDLDLWQRHVDASDGYSVGAGDGTTRSVADDPGETQIWGWCNGAAGVGLGRVVAAEAGVAGSDELADGVAALRGDLRTRPSLEASLCCGTSGRVAFMLDAGDTLEDPELVARGEELFGNLLERAEREGRIPLGNHLPMLPRFGLFTGLSGVGYAALQFEARERGRELPNVTRLE
ncbi:type 2 lanthipeptide synthetase LanM [Halorussus halobius]|uniref:type 2 lanthipeptide synthetase LanM n=1 Tax=Halorussus halobius TaxID=1710537 RepID=UPI00109282EB|nr:type 2 lanthipeptide synthetase LanM [Halorussus halobius]